MQEPFLLHFFGKSVASRLREVVIAIYSVLVTPYLEYCVHSWSPQLKKDRELLERVQQRTTNMTWIPL